MDYIKQAEDFLKSCNVTMQAVQAVPQTPPIWFNSSKDRDISHGIQWSITLHKGDIHGSTIQFFFWSSIADKEATDEKRKYAANKNYPYSKPSAYSVLASIYTECANDGFEYFCDCLGFDQDNIKARKSFEETLELNKKLESIFTSEELEKLAEIQ